VLHTSRYNSRHERPSDPQVDSLRVPPHSIEAEQSVIGGLLRDNAAFDRIADMMHPEDFYRYDHRIIFEQIVKMINASKPADVITVFETLTQLGKAEDVGGLAYLNAMAQNTPSAANIRRYAEIVRDRGMLRQLITVADEISGRPSARKARKSSRCWTRPNRRFSRLPSRARAAPPAGPPCSRC
jgi:replicative DNA helicase